ncbi:prepilin-type N-terminal cleavage/methylation domain-containing protein [Caenimonas koreensis DSM 17982]|uniref:Prepilin-type N-terminal cleavage/methylation domain-containing protein n=1 Tax=Caenimonas koreensis DSM 17982 TaxID=1121255 RepID=A0A844AST8_9BURK|nr:PilW family protein [Caenimonas koreensis]MRD47395.1 prepilin-type N-terminal cleavage/methylation domain-containing protein [Caenimonas koreensis DSM 17982]
MKRDPNFNSPRARMQGLSLIELMVSLTIGLILMVAVVSGYLGTASASRMADAQARMNEDAQAALNILTQHLRMTGNNPKQPDYAPATDRNPVFTGGGVDIIGCDGTFTNTAAAADLATLTCPVVSPGATPSDSIAVAYEADAFNTVKDAAGVPTDCLGQAIPATTIAAAVNRYNAALPAPKLEAIDVTFRLADNRFYVANLSGIPNLYCKGNGSATPQPLVENIESMQIKYGLDQAAAATNAVVGYLSATDMATTLAALTLDARARKVLSVRVCVIARSESPVNPTADPLSYWDCEGTLTTSTDQYLRRAYMTTVVLRNHVSGS